MSDTVKFKCSFPAFQTAIKIHGNGEGMRVQLEIPESEMAEAMKLLLMRGFLMDAEFSKASQHIEKHKNEVHY